MLFLLRPRQAWMPYYLPRNPEQQDVLNQQMRTAYHSTRRLPPYQPGGDQSSAPDVLAQLKSLAELRDSGALTDDEFGAAKAKVLSGSADT